MREIPIGERRITKAKRRVIVAMMHICPNGKRGGSILFRFEDEPCPPWQSRMSYKQWVKYDLA